MYWKYGIAIEQRGLTGPEALNYIPVVKMQLGWIDDVDVGKLLFRAIAREILSAAPANLAAFSGAAHPGEPTRGVLVQPYLKGGCNAGAGGSIAKYTPWLQGPCVDRWAIPSRNRGFLPHEVLFHELVHTLRDAAGHGNRRTPLGGALWKFTNLEEFAAVLTTNIFMSDPTNSRADKVGLRRDHMKGHKLEEEFSDSLAFYNLSAGVFPNIDQFCREDPWFTSRLAEVPSTFNPLHAYYHDRAEARKNSASAKAAARDANPPV